MAEETAPVNNQRPAMMLLATGLGVQASQIPGQPPMIVVQLTVHYGDAILATCTMPLTLDQARDHAEDVGRAVLEAEGINLPEKPKLVDGGGREL